MKFKNIIRVLSGYLTIFLVVLFCSCTKDDISDQNTVTDLDGNIYHYVTIGTQVWMVENLRVTKYRNGDPIPLVEDDSEWGKLSTGAMCVYNNDDNHLPVYGRMYNWYAVNDNRNIAPAGWHVPSTDEWQILVDYLGGNFLAAAKMKEVGTTHWKSPNSDATNESGLCILPGGDRYDRVAYGNMGSYGFYWSSTQSSQSNAWDRIFGYDGSYAYRHNHSKQFAYSIRCLKD